MECEQLRASQSTLPKDERLFGKMYFEDHDEKVKYYTGLPNYQTLIAVFSFVSSGMVACSRISLSPLSAVCYGPH